jgi:hypothetical protein
MTQLPKNKARSVGVSNHKIEHVRILPIPELAIHQLIRPAARGSH